jgi:hypothetical protein
LFDLNPKSGGGYLPLTLLTRKRREREGKEKNRGMGDLPRYGGIYDKIGKNVAKDVMRDMARDVSIYEKM